MAKHIQGIPVKKKYGQHFLRSQSVADIFIHSVSLDKTSSVLEIGCGDGFLTRTILQEPIARLWVFEIDPEWADYVNKKLGKDTRLKILLENILDADFQQLVPHAPWTLLSNIPYQITFPILHRIQQHRDLFNEGVIMIQEEVAQKIVKTSGKGYGYISLFFQYYFSWRLLDKVPPEASYPQQKVYSRLIYFKPKKEIIPIKKEQEFWKFIKQCFAQPRRMLRNNLMQTHYPLALIPEKFLTLRAQQMTMHDFLVLWDVLAS